MLLQKETMKVFSVENLYSLQRKSGKLQSDKEYLSPKIQNKDFGQRVNQFICSLDYGNVS